MQMIAKNGSKAIYEGGQLGQNLVQELQGALTLEDLQNYHVKETKPNTTMIGSHEVMVSPAPSSGPELLAFLSTVEYLSQTMNNFGQITADYLHSITNALENLENLQLQLGDLPDMNVNKLVEYMLDKRNMPSIVSDIQRQGLGSDPNYALSDPVAANVAVMDKKDNYVSVTTSLNTWFGSKVILCQMFNWPKLEQFFKIRSSCQLMQFHM